MFSFNRCFSQLNLTVNEKHCRTIVVSGIKIVLKEQTLQMSDQEYTF